VNAIRIGTRGSALALAQATWVKQQIENERPDLKIELVIIKTSGDALSMPHPKRLAERHLC
jgi:hydroxymethylbilane synthase